VVFVASEPLPNSASAAAKWQRIAEDIRRAVSAGGLRRGDQLPSEDQLATRYNASRAAVRRALAELHGQGLVELDSATGALLIQVGAM
jgi:GntR family transcriptional regulator